MIRKPSANSLLFGYLAFVAAGTLVLVGCEPVTDNQADAGSSVKVLGGNSKHVLDSEVEYGKYKFRKPNEVQKANCRWRVYKKVKGHWEQSSPRKVGAWNHLSNLAHRGSFSVHTPSLVDIQNCPKVESRK